MARKLRFMRSRARWIRAESVGPSTPQLRLSLSSRTVPVVLAVGLVVLVLVARRGQSG